MNNDLYQHIDPTAVGNDMHMLISDMAGRANIQIKGEQLGMDLSDRDLAGQVASLVKQREAHATPMRPPTPALSCSCAIRAASSMTVPSR